MSIKIAQLNISPKIQNSRFDIFVSQPDSLKEKLAGKIFMVADIKEEGAMAIKILNFLRDSVYNNYYNSDKIFLREKVPSLRVDHIFEASLAKINENFNNWIKQEKIKPPLNKINVTAGLIYENSIFLANHGNNQALLVYRAQEEDKGYKLVNILKDSGRTESKKIFSDVITGQLPKGSGLIICNEALPEYIPQKSIIGILSALPPISAAEQIKQKIDELKAYVPFFGLIIKNTVVQPVQEITKTEKTVLRAMPDDNSIINLNRTESLTEELLSPPRLVNPKKWISRLGRKPKPAPQLKLEIKDRIWVKKKKNAFYFIQKGFLALYGLLKAATGFLGALAVLLLRKSKALKAGPLIAKFKKLFQSLPPLFSRLSFKNKVLVALGLIFVSLFVASTLALKNKNEEEIEQQNWAEISNQIAQKQNQADASLLYSNEEGARKLYEEIKVLIEELPQETEEQIRQHEEFNAKYTSFLERIQRVKRVESPELVADLGNLLSSARPQNLSTVNAGALYAADRENQSVYIINPEDGLAAIITDTAKDLGQLAAPAVLGESVIYQAGPGQATILDIENESFVQPPINIPDYSAVGADVYNNRLYVLNGKNSQIYRFNFSGGSFSSPYSWISREADLSGALDMAIDGHIYVLLDTGEVRQFLRGESTDFKLEAIDPPLQSANRLEAEEEGDNIYILDRLGQRVVIFDKEGQFKFQIKLPGLKNISDIAVDRENKILYLLNEARVYKTDIAAPDQPSSVP